MAANYSNSYIINANLGHICVTIKDVRFFNFLNLKFKSEIPIQGGTMFQFSSGVNLASWGENIDITVLYLNENSSQVIIKSECALPTQIVDWGRNQSNVEKIYSHLASCVAYNQNFNNAPYQPVNNQNFNNPQPQQTPSFCRTCGTRLNADSKFCINCGTPVL